MKTFNGIVESFNGPVYGRNVKVPDDIVQYFKDLNVKRLVAEFNDEAINHCALMSAGKGVYFVNINKSICKQLKLEIGDKVSISLQEDTSKYGMPVPEEMEELLKVDPEGEKYFENLSDGKKRTLLHMIGLPKTSATRLKKAVVVLDYLKAAQGKLDFKELNIAFKEANKFY